VHINASILSNVLLNNNGMLARTEKQTYSWKLGFLSYFYESFLGHFLECRTTAVGFKYESHFSIPMFVNLYSSNIVNKNLHHCSFITDTFDSKV